jgi:hypothetical protein
MSGICAIAAAHSSNSKRSLDKRTIGFGPLKAKFFSAKSGPAASVIVPRCFLSLSPKEPEQEGQ